MGRIKDKPAKAAEAFTCRRCGVCCTLHQAFVTPADIERITAYLGITLNDWENLYDDRRWQYSEYRLIRHINGACAFLKLSEGLATCQIHNVKPACCARWQAGPDKKECKEGIERVKEVK
ncbi:MAG: YkgJ family cysteine cluster protein [Dehalococcoidales bacterium]